MKIFGRLRPSYLAAFYSCLLWPGFNVVRGSNEQDIYFTSDTQTVKQVISQLGVNYDYFSAPCMIDSGRGTLFVACYASTGHDGRGDAILLELTHDGTLLATNTVFSNPAYGCRNTTIFRTASNSVLYAFNIFYVSRGQPTNSIRILRSTDNCTTWSSTNMLQGFSVDDPELTAYTKGPTTSGTMAQVGTKILLPYYSGITADGAYYTSLLQSSTDDGLTWGGITTIYNANPESMHAYEPSLTKIGGSNVLVSIRVQHAGGTSNYFARSFDAGATWGAASNTFESLSKTDVLLTSSGLLLATYRATPYGSGALYRVSRDLGYTWLAERWMDSGAYTPQYSSVVETSTSMFAVVYGKDPDYVSGATSPLFLRYGGWVGTSPLGDDFGQPVLITVTANPTNGGSVAGGGIYPLGTNVVLTALASNNWLFSQWSDSVTNNPRMITAPTTNVTYTANFAPRPSQLFFQEGGGQVASWLLATNGSFQAARLLGAAGGWRLQSAGDIDGDGVSDLLFQDATRNTGGWFLNADGSVRDARFWFNIGGWEIKAAGDYENIGRAQIFFQTAAGSAAYWRLDTNGTFLAAVQLGNMGTWKLRGAGDLDGDRKAELFWQNNAGMVAIWWHNPDDSIRGTVPFGTGEWVLCGVADVDFDGVCDLIWQTPDSRTGGWFMTTNGTARAASFWWPTGGWKLKAAGR